MDGIEFEKFQCMTCGHVWWAEPGHHLGHVEYDARGCRFNFDPHPQFRGDRYRGCFKCGGIYHEWTTYEAFAKRRAAWGGFWAEVDRFEERYREGLEIINTLLGHTLPG